MFGDLASKMYEFGSFQLDLTRKILRRTDGSTVSLTPKALNVLAALVEGKGNLLTKEELMRRVWSDSFVEESNLTQTISVLRRTLGESPEHHRYIVTEPGRGYRFVAEVKEISSILPSQPENSTPEALSGDVEIEKPAEIDETEDAGAMAKRGKRSRIGIFVAGFLILTLAVYFLFFRTKQANAPENAREIKSIAVLPFKTIGADDEQKYVGLGMTETLIVKLSKIKRIFVRQTSAVLRYADKQTDPVNIGGELRVDALLDGSVQRDGERVRVAVTLVRVSDGTPLWAETFDDKFTNIFEVQDSISEKVAHALTLELTGEEQSAVKKRYTHNLEADQFYQKGRYFWNKRTMNGFTHAIEHFNHAIRLDPNYALAYAGLAETYALVNLYNSTQDPQAFPNARRAATRALELDDNLAAAHAALALVKFQYDYDWAGAEKSYLLAIDRDPNYATARQWYGEFLSFRKRTGEAVREMEKAVELDPASPSTNNALALPYLIAGQSEKALALTEKALEMDADFSMALTYKGRALVQLRRYDEAVEVYRKAIAATGGSAFNTACLGHVFAVAGRADEARKILSELETRARTSYVAPYNFAVVYSGLGEREKALEYLRKAVTEKDLLVSVLGSDSRFDNLAEDAGFRELLREIDID